MRYMLLIKATKYFEAGVEYSQEENLARIAFRKALAQADVLVATEALQPSSFGVRISYLDKQGEPIVQAGPFSTDTTLLAEYILLDVETEEEALNWALQMPVPKNRDNYEIELRRLEDNPDFLRERGIHPMEVDLKDLLSMLKTN